MNALNAIGQNLNPLQLLQGGAAAGSSLSGVDPIDMLMSFFGNQGGGQGPSGGEVCGCGNGGSQHGAFSSGCKACQKNQSLGF